ncbi:microtubule nucleation factor SSNA1-like isoform X1 [Rhea pennata]|uniref:microtubule nucleation factor SSNA1-like isoform X1 n=2 Tax=Rhea pennata TaxID=8795 RepID=UPI002E26138E
MYRQEPFCVRFAFCEEALGVQKAAEGASGSGGGAEGELWRMTQQGAALQGYNNELVKCIEDLCMQKEELNKQIQQAEEEKNKLQHQIQVLNEKLECVCENLAQKVASRNELDKILAETEAAYMKILDSSRTLLNVLKKEVGSLKSTPELKSHVT